MPSTFMFSILAGVAIATVIFFMFGSEDHQQPQHRYGHTQRDEHEQPEFTYERRRRKRQPKYNETCTICFNEFLSDDYTTLHCQHIFHKECIEKWKGSSALPAACPMCRAKV